MAFRRRPTQGMSNILCKIRGFREGGSIVGSPHQPDPHCRTLCWPTKARAASPLSGVWRIESEKLCGVRSGGRIKFTVAAGTLQGLLSRLCEACAALATNGGERPALRDGRHRHGGVIVLIAFRRHRISAPTSSRYCRFSPLVPIARCLQRWPCEPVARIDLQSRCRPKW